MAEGFAPDPEVLTVEGQRRDRDRRAGLSAIGSTGPAA